MVGPWGLGKVSATTAAEEYRRAFDADPLVAAVPAEFRQEYDRLRTMFANAALDYQLLTVVHDRAHLLFEPLLRARFLGAPQGPDQGCRSQWATPSDRDQQLLRRRMRGASVPWRAPSPRPPSTVPRRGARSFRLGPRRGLSARATQSDRRTRHDRAAQPRRPPTMGTRLMPRDAVIALMDLGEVANRLWGSTWSE